MPSGKRNRQVRRALANLDQVDRQALDDVLVHGSVEITRTQRSIQFSGPLPPPEVLAKYEDVAPGSAAVIVSMAHTQMAHRQSMEKAVINGNVDAQRRGQHYALTVTILAFATALGFGLMGFPSVAGIITGTTLIALAGLFITSKHMQSGERKAKDKVRHPLQNK